MPLLTPGEEARKGDEKFVIGGAVSLWERVEEYEGLMNAVREWMDGCLSRLHKLAVQ